MKKSTFTVLRVVSAAIAIIVTETVPALSSNVQGIWPDEARGAKLGRPDWVLVIPAQRMPDGSLIVWDRTNDWVRQWIVPRTTPAGLRTVAIVGDSEDKRVISASEIDNMRSTALRQIAQKYTAPAIALVVSGTDGEVVAGWVPGTNATWDYSEKTADREAALSVIDGIFSGERKSAPDNSNVAKGVKIIAQRLNSQTGLMEYRIKPTSQIVEGELATVNGLTINGREDADPSILEVRMEKGIDIVSALKAAGFQIF